MPKQVSKVLFPCGFCRKIPMTGMTVSFYGLINVDGFQEGV